MHVASTWRTVPRQAVERGLPIAGVAEGIAEIRSESEAWERRIKMAQRMVKCVKLQRLLPGLDEPPFDNELGRRIFENVSQDAWKMWVEQLKMIVNEYRLNLADREAQRMVRQVMEQFFFGEGAPPPPDYVPPPAKS